MPVPFSNTHIRLALMFILLRLLLLLLLLRALQSMMILGLLHDCSTFVPIL
jgi:hypothetical protein